VELLVLGGTGFVGRSVVEQALGRGDEVTTLNRGISRAPADGVRTIQVDRRAPNALAGALGDGKWDAVIDTWAGAPAIVQDSAGLLRDRVGHYGYVSSRSVYRWPLPTGIDESAPVVDGDPGSPEQRDYAAAKRGAELAVLESFPGRVLLARAGLILGPYEDVGRLPWWLKRLSRGGRVPAPGPAERRLQYIDARDLAAWMLDAAERGLSGTFNTVSRPGHATMGQLLEASNDVVGEGAELVWLSPEVIEAAGVSGWIDLPIWVPPTGEMAGLHDGDVSAAYAEGLTCRPVRDTVADTWHWLQAVGCPEPRGDRPPLGLPPEVEQALSAAAEAVGLRDRQSR
jgi:2'-hydroxyisoflavone reductase